MKTQCKSCQNWRSEIPADERTAPEVAHVTSDKGWCVNFKKVMFNNSMCGEWRARSTDAIA